MKHGTTRVRTRVLACIMAALLFVTSVPIAFTTLASDEKTAQLSDLKDYATMQELLAKNLRGGVKKVTYAADDEVVFIVEMSTESLLEAKDSDENLSHYLSRTESAVQLNKITNEQDAAINAIGKINAPEMEILYRYSTIMNGFSVKTIYGKKAELEALPGVKSVSVAKTYEYEAPVNGYETMATGSVDADMMDAGQANSAGYTGKGTVTAILDTGLDINHEAFQKAPEDPKLSLEDIKTALDEGLTASATAEQLYKSEKIPFAYDYTGRKGDADVTGGVNHGTHVSGIVGANGNDFKGVAPDTQIAMLKVFDDAGMSSSAAILAALEDAVILGVDSINMSLGSPAGFTTELDDEGEESSEMAVYKRVENAGISLMCSAGNNYSSPLYNIEMTHLALLANPDNGIAGSPSTYLQAISVASVNAVGMTEEYIYFVAGDKHIEYTNNATKPEAKWSSLDGTFDVAVIGGTGTKEDFANAGDIKGKIALVKRGSINFTEKEKNAYSSGAKALIVYDSDPDATELINMQLNELLPAAFISNADGEYIKGMENKTIENHGTMSEIRISADGGRMSDFSSLGVAPDLTLKPEITAPGGSIFSTLPIGDPEDTDNDGYGYMSGTSMASPQMAGAASVVREFVNENFPSLLDIQKRDLVNSLLLSTATQVVDEYNIPYTPRKQGAGLANVMNAIKAMAYISVKGDTRPQAELGYNEDGTFTFEFMVNNLSEETKTYDISLIPLTAKIEREEYISELSSLKNKNRIQKGKKA